MKTHRIKLSNGRVVLLEEGDSVLGLSLETEGHEFDVDAYICDINKSGVLVMPNSGDATWRMCHGLVEQG